MEIAIIDSNILASMGLQSLLKDIIPMVSISVFRSYEELAFADPGRFVHFFVSSGIYFENAQFFISQSHRSIVLVHGDAYPRIAGLLTLNVCQDEKSLVKDILALRRRGHDGGAHSSMPASSHNVLSSRESEVAVLLAKGFINKEIADRLCVSLNTVITHRKNIMDKLRARSLADIIIYVVMNGLTTVDDL